MIVYESCQPTGSHYGHGNPTVQTVGGAVKVNCRSGPEAPSEFIAARLSPWHGLNTVDIIIIGRTWTPPWMEHSRLILAGLLHLHFCLEIWQGKCLFLSSIPHCCCCRHCCNRPLPLPLAIPSPCLRQLVLKFALLSKSRRMPKNRMGK